MADDVAIPGTHSKVSRPVAFAGLAGVGVLIIIYYRKKSATAAAAPATTTSQYPPDGTSGNPSDPYSTDPATGQTYGNEAAGSGGTYGAYGSGAASGQYYDPATGAYDLTSPYGTATGTTPYQTQGGPPFANNSAWSDWVIQELQAQNSAVNTGALTDALGLYLAGQPLNATERQLVFDATGVAGDPPVAGPNGYPPKLQGDGSTGGHPHPSTTVAVPNVVGQKVGPAHNALVRAGLTVGNRPNSNWIVTATAPKAGTKVARGHSVDITAKA